jgi:ribosomal protein S18 acetylase RimI-like enzyme
MITYSNTHDFKAADLKQLFLSVDWSSGHYPERLAIAMKNFKSVFSAWDDDRLVGMVCVMDDGVMNAYIHYVLVDPEYNGQGIGHELMRKMKMKYKDYLRIIVIAYDKEADFYKSCGFEGAEDKKAMFITELWT